MRQQTGSRNRGWLSAIGNRLSVAAGVALVAGMMAVTARAEVSATATGGTVTEYPQGGKQWRAFVFTNSTDYPVSEIPKMTANNAPSGVASASSEQGVNLAWKAMDQDAVSRWSSGGGMPQWLQYQFASGKVISGYDFIAFSATPSQTPSNFTLQASNDGSNWTILDTQTNKSALSQQYVFGNTVSYTYYRLNVTAVGGGGATLVSLLEFKLYSMPALAVTVGGDVEYLVVAAGGAGGSSPDTGGGGAGGMLTGSVTLAAGTYPVSVGKASGLDSIFSTLRAIGGGAGANTSPGTGAAGGSGGGSVRINSGGPPGYAGGAGTFGQGNKGGDGYSNGFWTGGGGGGAGGPGVDANGVDYISAGGPGVSSSISGSPVPYAAGGKGYHRSANDPSGKGKAGDPNTGNGGNGGYNSSAGGAGGSGIVIIRYALPPKGTVILMR